MIGAGLLDLTVIGIVVLAGGGFLLSWSRYRTIGAGLQTVGLTVAWALFLVMITDLLRLHVAKSLYLLAQPIWVLAGTGAILLQRLSREEWRGLRRAFLPARPSASPEEIVSTCHALAHARHAAWMAGLSFFTIALAASIFNMPGSARLRMLDHIASVLMPLLCAPILAELLYGHLEHRWRSRLERDHPERFVRESKPAWAWAIVYGGVWLFVWMVFAQSGIPVRWMP